MRYLLSILLTLASAAPGYAAGATLPGFNYGATIYVDSGRGNDANNGLTPLTPKRTIAAVRAMSPGATAIIALKRNSYWREALYGLPAGARIIAYGTGNAPVLDSADVAAAWVATAGRTKVWEIAWTKDTSYEADSGSSLILLWEGETQLAATTSIALVESTPGRFYHDAAAGKVYYHPTASVNPAAYQVNITKRPEGIYQYEAAITIDGIRTRRSWAHYGGASNGLNGTTKNSIVDGCGIHHHVLKAGTIQDIVYLDTSPTHTAGTNPLTIYQPDGTGATAAATRVFGIGSAATKTIQGAFYAHTSNDPAGSFATLTYDQCYVSYGQGFSGTAAGAFTTSNSLVENGTVGANLASGAPSTVSRTLFRNCTGSAGGNAILSDAGPVDTSNRERTVSNSVIYLSDLLTTAINGALLSPRQGSITFTNCVFYFDTPARGGAAIFARSNGAGNGLTLTVNKCVFLLPKGDFRAVSTFDANVTYVGDHNVFIRTDGFASFIPFLFNNAGLQGLTAWRTASGQDANSVYLTTAQGATFWAGTPANGDFRINGSNAVSDADGTVYTGQFPDGTALSTVGVQSHYNWNTRAVVNTAPTKWPVPPQTMAQANRYVENPGVWNFYP